MRGGKLRFGIVSAAAVAAALIAGCSQMPAFPKLPIGDVIGQETLTPAQQEAEIKELADAQVRNTTDAGGTGMAPPYAPASVSPPE